MATPFTRGEEITVQNERGQIEAVVVIDSSDYPHRVYVESEDASCRWVAFEGKRGHVWQVRDEQ